MTRVNPWGAPSQVFSWKYPHQGSLYLALGLIFSGFVFLGCVSAAGGEWVVRVRSMGDPTPVQTQRR